jgi:hypothetical protein
LYLVSETRSAIIIDPSASSTSTWFSKDARTPLPIASSKRVCAPGGEMVDVVVDGLACGIFGLAALSLCICLEFVLESKGSPTARSYSQCWLHSGIFADSTRLLDSEIQGPGRT